MLLSRSMLISGSELDPNVLGGLAGLYMDADTTTARSGANVTAWSASNPGGPTLTPSGAQPTYSATGFQSRPAVLFNNSYLSAGLSLASSRTIFVVFQTGPGGSQHVAAMGNLLLQYNAAAGYRAYTSGGESNSLDITNAVPIIETGLFDGSLVSERHIRAGTLLGGPAAPGTVGGSGVLVGANASGTAGLAGGAVGAIAFYNRALSSDEILFLEAWASRKFGLTVPAGNQYL